MAGTVLLALAILVREPGQPYIVPGSGTQPIKLVPKQGGANVAGKKDKQHQLTLRARVLQKNVDAYNLLIDNDRLYCPSGPNLVVFGSNLAVLDAKKRKYVHFVEDRELKDLGAMAAADGKIFVDQVFADEIVVFDAATMKRIDKIPVPGGEGCMVASKDGKSIFYASNRKDQFCIIDAKTCKIVDTIAFPEGGRGCLCVALAPDGDRLFLGIQRGGKPGLDRDGKRHAGGGCFLAVFDLKKRDYVGALHLAEIQDNVARTPDDSMPFSMLFSADGKRLHVGMFQCNLGIYEIDPAQLKIKRHISFEANGMEPSFTWVDPLSQANYRGWLLSANRNNHEIAVVDAATAKLLARLSFGDRKDRGRFCRVRVNHDGIYVTDEAAHKLYELDGRQLAKLLEGAGKDGGVLRISLQEGD